MSKPESTDRIYLTDDGTLDTVLRCGDCGEEFRYNYDGGHDEVDNDERTDEQRYDEFVEWAISDAEELHECEETGQLASIIFRTWRQV